MERQIVQSRGFDKTKKNEDKLGALGVTIAVLFLAVSILTLGLVVDERISRLGQQIAIVKTSIKRGVIAQSYAFSKAESEKRGIILPFCFGTICIWLVLIIFLNKRKSYPSGGSS
jgi:hypothetical protein